MPRKSDVKQAIFEVWDSNHELSPKEIRREVMEKLGNKRSNEYTYPGLRRVQQCVQEFKTKLGQLVDEDKPWSIGASVKFKLPPEANRDLFDIWRVSLAMGNPISIRQAKWIIHIRSLFNEPTLTGNTYSAKVNRNLMLIRQSWLYGLLERASQIIGESYFNTFNLDAASFLPNWERSTSLKLGVTSHVNYSQEALTKIEKFGTSLTSPPVSVQSVEEAVWQGVMAKPFPGEEMMMTFTTPDNILQEEDDLVAAYWLTHLSKGPLWNDLPPPREALRRSEERRQQREKGMFVPDSGESGSTCSYQVDIRYKLLNWVKTHHSMSIRDYYTLGEKPHASLALSPNLLRRVGYKVSPDYIESYSNMHESELKINHKGWSRIPVEVKQRLIHDEQTDDDNDILSNADDQVALEQERLEKELIELVERKGAASLGKGKRELDDFWNPIIDEWNTRHPHSINWSSIPHDWRDFESTYKSLKKKYTQGPRSSGSDI